VEWTGARVGRVVYGGSRRDDGELLDRRCRVNDSAKPMLRKEPLTTEANHSLSPQIEEVHNAAMG